MTLLLTSFHCHLCVGVFWGAVWQELEAFLKENTVFLRDINVEIRKNTYLLEAWSRVSQSFFVELGGCLVLHAIFKLLM